MKLTKEQVQYSVNSNGNVEIHRIWTHRIDESSIRVLEYPSHIDRKRVTKITTHDDFRLVWNWINLKKIIVPYGCCFENNLPSHFVGMIEYK